jgi:hypothetical protein
MTIVPPVKLRSGVGQAVPQVAAGLVVLAIAQFFGLNELPIGR